MSDEQHPDVLTFGTHVYPALKITEEPDPQHPAWFDPESAVDFEYFVFLTSFQETFNARWEIGNRSYGRLNPMYYYGGTDREASISFTLPAMTVQESEQNLLKCSELSRAVYGRYRAWDIDPRVTDFTMVGHRYFRVDFGNLIMNERVFISSFSFKINPEAGVFEHDKDYYTAEAAVSRMDPEGSGANPVQTGETGNLLPRQIDVEISMIFRHDYPLGFGGPRRVGHTDRWAANNNKDFPHGSGIDVQEYMSRTFTASEMAEVERAMEDLAERINALESPED